MLTRYITLLDHEWCSEYCLSQGSRLLDWGSDHSHSWTDLTTSCKNLEDIFIETLPMNHFKSQQVLPTRM